jgi:CubicO group peptidase (beta-lactamase class C family)
LLSHTAGATVHGFSGYPRGTRPLPSSVDVVRGAKNTNSPPVKLIGKKGSFSYSGGGYMIAQVFAEDISQLPFAQLLQELILGPIKMTKSCYTQPLDPKKIEPLHITPAKPGPWSRLIRRPGTWHNFPEKAPAGLWTTPRDYAGFVTALMDSIHGNESPLSPNVAQAMVTTVSNNYGLGVGVIKGADGKLFSVSHDGVNSPGYRTEFEGFRTSCVVVMTNSPSGLSLSQEALNGAYILAKQKRHVRAENTGGRTLLACLR